MKTASTGFVNALTGTPSQVSTVHLRLRCPRPARANTTLPLTSVSTAAGAATVNAKINGMTLPGGAGRRHQLGPRDLPGRSVHLDTSTSLVVITDGSPTFYGNQEGPGSRTRFREVENGIFSANAVKAEGTKLIAFGVGDGVGSAGAGLNLRSISGPTLNTDYYQTADYAAAGAQLRGAGPREVARVRSSVVKQVVPSTTATGSTAGAQPQGGWTFTGASGNADISFDAPAHADHGAAERARPTSRSRSPTGRPPDRSR